jgi:NitT/TauT family transport system permease protein
MLAGLAPRIGNLLYAPIQTLFALPKITLVPLFILWFGVSTFQHVMFTSVVVFFFFFFAVFSGVRGTSQALKNAFVLMGASRWQRIRFLILPSCLGWIALALKLALPYAFVAAISAEVVASTSGLGNLVKTSAQVMNAAGVFASLIALLCISLMCSFIANRAASHFARYNQ